MSCLRNQYTHQVPYYSSSELPTDPTRPRSVVCHQALVNQSRWSCCTGTQVPPQLTPRQLTAIAASAAAIPAAPVAALAAGLVRHFHRSLAVGRPGPQAERPPARRQPLARTARPALHLAAVPAAMTDPVAPCRIRRRPRRPAPPAHRSHPPRCRPRHPDRTAAAGVVTCRGPAHRPGSPAWSRPAPGRTCAPHER